MKTENKAAASANPLAPATPDATEDFIKSRIFTIRGVQVMLDRDLAVLYGVTTSRLNEQVKRNSARFPARFMFRPDQQDMQNLMSQNAISSWGVEGGTHDEVLLKSQTVISSWGGVRKPPCVFTEHGIIMLASVLKSETAIRASVMITDAFVAMRRALASIAPIVARLDAMERRQITDQSRNEENQRRNEERFDTIFKAMDGGDFPPQKVFFEERHYEAYSFARRLVRKATKSLVLVDGYCDDTTLDILSQKRGGVAATVATAARTPLTATAVEKFNRQNPTLAVRTTAAFHDRFLILDGKILYHLGASLKDLGRKYCAVSKLDAAFIPSILERM